MNPIEILGEILGAGGGNRRGGAPGGDILKDILGGGAGAGQGSTSGGVEFPGILRDGPTSGRGGARAPSSKELEDLLGVGRSSPSAGAPKRTETPRAEVPRAEAPRSGMPQGDIFGQEPQRQAPPPMSQAEKEQLTVLIRAMIHAGKADGRIDAREQQAILDKVGSTDPETVQFLREEFSKATNARDFAWSVPLGMESAVYAASITTIELDNQTEIAYLKELAQGLRLAPKLCNQIHQQYGVRTIF